MASSHGDRNPQSVDNGSMIFRPVRALILAVGIWLVGFVWGSIVFMIPALKSTAPIPFVSNNPWISFPILLIWLPLTYLAARYHLNNAPEPETDGLVLGCILALSNFLLDVVVIVIAFKAGVQYFASATVLLGYALLLVIPWLVGRAMEDAASTR